MQKLTKEAENILHQRFGKDSVIALATTVDHVPYVRNVNAFYDDGSFYVSILRKDCCSLTEQGTKLILRCNVQISYNGNY